MNVTYHHFPVDHVIRIPQASHPTTHGRSISRTNVLSLSGISNPSAQASTNELATQIGDATAHEIPRGSTSTQKTTVAPPKAVTAFQVGLTGHERTLVSRLHRRSAP